MQTLASPWHRRGHGWDAIASKVETGELRLDVVELRRLHLAFGVPLAAFVRRIEEALADAAERS